MTAPYSWTSNTSIRNYPTICFGIVDTASSAVEQLRAESGKLTQAFDPDTEYAEIVLNNRSVLEMLYLASGYVEVPETDVDRQYVSAASTRSETDWLDRTMASSRMSTGVSVESNVAAPVSSDPLLFWSR